MRIIDRYLLRQYVQVFVICFCSLTGLFIVFHAFGNLDEFLDFAEKDGNLATILAVYYGYQTIYFFDLMAGTLALIAAMFTVTWIQRHNELTALLAAGVPQGRVMAPVIAACVAVSLFAAANRELIVPSIRSQLSSDPKDLAGDAGQPLQFRYDNATDVLIRGRKSYAREMRIEKPNFLMPLDLHRQAKLIAAADAIYLPATDEHPGGYLFKRVEQPRSVDKLPSLSSRGRTLVITHMDAHEWVGPDECFVVSEVTFEQLTGGTQWQLFSSTRALIAALNSRSVDFGADVRVKIHSRLVQPLLDVTLLFLGLPLVLSRRHANVFVAVGKTLGVVVFFMVVVLGCQYLGKNVLLSPSLSAWLPLMIFVPAAVALSDPLRE